MFFSFKRMEREINAKVTQQVSMRFDRSTTRMLELLNYLQNFINCQDCPTVTVFISYWPDVACLKLACVLFGSIGKEGLSR